MTDKQENYLSSVIYCICLVLFWLPTLGTAQINLSKKKEKGTTRAVVVGISNYQNQDIPDLSYAHQDAMVFANYLQTYPGGSLSKDNIILLTEEEASLGAINAALDWVLEESLPGDEVILYFSGHGDVEKKTRYERGYLLAYDTPYNNYRTNAIKVGDLNDIIATLTLDMDVKVMMISDACRSGNLAGSTINGAGLTSEEISKQTANEIIIMSCQANQESQESAEWGGGRGLFSFVFVNGLLGLADKLPADESVSLLEMQTYLLSEIPQINGQQVPLIKGGNYGATLSKVDGELLSMVLEDAQLGSSRLLQEINTVGTVTAIAATDTKEQDQLRISFEEALTRGNLLSPKGESAYDYYLALGEMAQSRGEQQEKRKLIIAFQDRVQQALNAYLQSDPQEMEARWNNNTQQYRAYASYLEKAIELLGENDKNRIELLAKQYYFEGLVLRLEADQLYYKTKRDSLYGLAMAKQEKALSFENKAAYIYNELGLLSRRFRDYIKANAYFEAASDLSPTWVIPYVNAAHTYRSLKDFIKAEAMALKAIETKSDYAAAYNAMGIISRSQKDYGKAENYFTKAIDTKKGYATAHYNLGNLFKAVGEMEKAILSYEKAIALTPNYAKAIYNLGRTYEGMGLLDKAIETHQRNVEVNLDYFNSYRNLADLLIEAGEYKRAETVLQLAKKNIPYEEEIYNSLGLLYPQMKKYEEGEAVLKEGLSQFPGNPNFIFNLGIVYIFAENWEASEKIYREYIELVPEDHEGYLNLACTLDQSGKPEQALEFVKLALEYGYPLEALENEEQLTKTKSLPAFQKVLETLKE